MKKLDGKVAIITGGASGIGEAEVRKFVGAGARVVIADLQEAKGKQLAASLGESVLFRKADVTSESDFQQLVEAAIQRFGRLDCLLNNAGFGCGSKPITETPVEEFDSQMAVLLRGTFLGMKHAGAWMKQQKSGTIVNTSSVAGISGGYANHVYSAAKAGVVSLTRTAALELGESGIRVNCVCPGSIVTPIFLRGIPLSEEEMQPALATVASKMTHNPLGRAGTPGDVADVALWLASEDSGYVTGQAIVVDGGLTGGVKWSDMNVWTNGLYSELAGQFPAAFARMAGK